MKRPFFLLFLFVFLTGTFAQSPPSGEEVSFRFVRGDDMFYVPWEKNGQELIRLYDLLDQYRKEILSGVMPVYVDGYSSSLSTEAQNRRLAFIRSNRVKSEMIVRKGLKEEHFITTNHVVDHLGNKDIVVVTLRIPAKEEPLRAAPAEERPPVKETPLPIEPAEEPQPEPLPETVVPEVSAPLYRFALRTNLLYDALLTPTIGVEWRASEHIGVKLDGSYAHWGSNHGRVQKLWLVSPEVRWYTGRDKRFYLGVGAQVGETNVYKGMARILSKDTGYQGTLYGGGLTVGYQLPIIHTLSVDFNLGIGCTHFSYDTFRISNGVRVYQKRNLSKNFWGPTQAGISLVWRMGRSGGGI